jgi:hypothetical protein
MLRFLGLVGHHGAGKSQLCRIAQRELGWRVVVKRDVLKAICPADSRLTPGWEEWYRSEFRRQGGFQIMRDILAAIPPSTNVSIIDSIHTEGEWAAIKTTDEAALLIGVFSPESVRKARNLGRQNYSDEVRLHSWHESRMSVVPCLLSQLDWAFSGAVGEEAMATALRCLSEFIAAGTTQAPKQC